jgi:hypothetical protein
MQELINSAVVILIQVVADTHKVAYLIRSVHLSHFELCNYRLDCQLSDTHVFVVCKLQ